MKQKENLAYNFNRLFVGVSVLLVVSIAYLFNLDILLYFSSILFIFYEFYKSLLKSKYLTFFLFIIFISISDKLEIIIKIVITNNTKKILKYLLE